MIRKLLAPLFVWVFGVLVLLSLCIWQVARLEWKEALISEIELAMSQSAVSYQLGLENFTHVEIEGLILEGYTDILTSNEYGIGYRRVVPLDVDNSIILFEIGYFPESTKSDLPDLEGLSIATRGHVFIPKNKNKLFADEAKNVWNGYDLLGMSEQLGTLQELVIASEDRHISFKADPIRNDLPNNHLQYAITWALFALAWTLMSGYWGYRRVKL